MSEVKEIFHRKRIAFLGTKYYPLKGGTERAIEYLIEAYKDKYDITIYAYHNKQSLKGSSDIHVVTLPEIPFGSFGVFVYYLLCAFHAVFKGRYDLIHVHKTDTAIVIPILKLKYKNIVATSHEAPYNRDKWSFIGRVYFHLMEKLFVRSSASLTCVSTTLADYYNNKYDANVKFIPTMVEPRTDLDKFNIDSFLLENEIKGEYIVFAARRVIATKGLHTLLKALGEINFKGQLIVAGDLTQLPDYTRKLMQLSKGLNVKYIGFIGDPLILMNLIKRAKLFVFPSETEAMSMMLLEVAAVKTPMICSDIPENITVFDESEVTFFRNKDVDDLATVLAKNINNAEVLKSKTEAAYRKVREKYALDKVASMYENVYLELLNRKK